MAVYVDAARWEWMGFKWCHLLADSLEELHAFRTRLSHRPGVFQCPPAVKFPHYDITEGQRDRAIELGAIPIGNRETVAKARALRQEYFGDLADDSA